jgi:hypothetical protein
MGVSSRRGALFVRCWQVPLVHARAADDRARGRRGPAARCVARGSAVRGARGKRAACNAQRAHYAPRDVRTSPKARTAHRAARDAQHSARDIQHTTYRTDIQRATRPMQHAIMQHATHSIRHPAHTQCTPRRACRAVRRRARAVQGIDPRACLAQPGVTSAAPAGRWCVCVCLFASSSACLSSVAIIAVISMVAIHYSH